VFRGDRGGCKQMGGHRSGGGGATRWKRNGWYEGPGRLVRGPKRGGPAKQVRAKVRGKDRGKPRTRRDFGHPRAIRAGVLSGASHECGHTKTEDTSLGFKKGAGGSRKRSWQETKKPGVPHGRSGKPEPPTQSHRGFGKVTRQSGPGRFGLAGPCAGKRDQGKRHGGELRGGAGIISSAPI